MKVHQPAEEVLVMSGRPLVVVLSAVLAGGATLSGAAAAAAPVPNLFAVVDQRGRLVQGGGVSGVTRLGAGRYEVTFTADVSGCAYVATTINAYSQALVVFTAGAI